VVRSPLPQVEQVETPSSAFFKARQNKVAQSCKYVSNLLKRVEPVSLKTVAQSEDFTAHISPSEMFVPGPSMEYDVPHLFSDQGISYDDFVK